MISKIFPEKEPTLYQDNTIRMFKYDRLISSQTNLQEALKSYQNPQNKKYQGIMKGHITRLNRIMYSFALYFRREFRYDFVQWGRDLMEDDKVSSWILSEDRIAYGGINFLHESDKTLGEIWVLHWAWVHPFHRNAGRLSYAWDTVTKGKGPIFLSEPVSQQMALFALKRENIHPASRERLKYWLSGGHVDLIGGL